MGSLGGSSARTGFGLDSGSLRLLELGPMYVCVFVLVCLSLAWRFVLVCFAYFWGVDLHAHVHCCFMLWLCVCVCVGAYMGAHNSHSVDNDNNCKIRSMK